MVRTVAFAFLLTIQVVFSQRPGFDQYLDSLGPEAVQCAGKCKKTPQAQLKICIKVSGQAFNVDKDRYKCLKEQCRIMNDRHHLENLHGGMCSMDDYHNYNGLGDSLYNGPPPHRGYSPYPGPHTMMDEYPPYHDHGPYGHHPYDHNPYDHNPYDHNPYNGPPHFPDEAPHNRYPHQHQPPNQQGYNNGGYAPFPSRHNPNYPPPPHQAPYHHPPPVPLASYPPPPPPAPYHRSDYRHYP